MQERHGSLYTAAEPLHSLPLGVADTCRAARKRTEPPTTSREAEPGPTQTGLPLFTSLDPPETNVPPTHIGTSIGARMDAADREDTLDDPTGVSLFRHSGWKHNRLRVYESFRRTHQPGNRLIGFRECGRRAYVFESVDRPGEYALGGSACHDRFCLPCARERSRVIGTNVLNYIQGKQARFLTLTLRSTTEPLDQLLAKLTTDFTVLRRSKLWRNKVTGGVAFIEVKWVEKTHRWHPHLHCLVQGRYLPTQELSKLWFEVTGTSHIIDIRYVRDEKHVTHYITKYASKPLDGTVVGEPDRLDEAVLALKGKRLCLTFGSWRGFVLTERPEDGDWVQLGSLAEFIERAEQGDSDAQQALTVLEVHYTIQVRGSPPTNDTTGSHLTYEQTLLPIDSLNEHWCDVG